MIKTVFITLVFCGYLVCGAGLVGAAGTHENVDDSPTEVLSDQLSTTFDDDDFDADFGDNLTNGAPKRLIADPLQPLNRGVFWFNDKLYFYLFKPVAIGYRFVVPRPARVSVGNFFSNLATPIRASNALLQFKFRDFGTELYRFAVNSTVGVVGLFDPAESMLGVEKSVEDFGLTLGHYQIGHGFYLVLPIVGPSSLRDGCGVFVDSYLDPLRYANLNSVEHLSVKLIDAETRLSLDRNTYEGIVADAIDPYLFIRAAYAQRRLAQVGDDTYNVNIFESPLFDSEFFNPFDWFGIIL